MYTSVNPSGEAVLTSTKNLYYDQKYEKFQFLEVKFSRYLKRRDFVMAGVRFKS